MSAGQPTPHSTSTSPVLAYPRPYPMPPIESRVHPLDREVAREAVLATMTLVVVVLAAMTAIGVSGWLAG